VGTIFQDSPIKLDKWLSAIWLVANAKNGMTSHELARSIGVTQKTGWFMLHRIRLAMQGESFEKLEGEVEVDETFIGGQARYMHKDRREKRIKGRGPAGKAVVIGLLQRRGEVRIKVVPGAKKKTVQTEVRDNVEPGSDVFTDALPSYEGLDPEYVHQVINDAERCAKSNVDTDCVESFWSLLKRVIKGTYVSVGPFHLFRYLDGRAFRFNSGKGNGAGRFLAVGASVAGRRLTYADAIGDTATE
jgi:transposase-like protein